MLCDVKYEIGLKRKNIYWAMGSAVLIWHFLNTSSEFKFVIEVKFENQWR